MSYIKWILYIGFYAILFTAASPIFNNFNIIMLIITTVIYTVAIIPAVKKEISIKMSSFGRLFFNFKRICTDISQTSFTLVYIEADNQSDRSRLIFKIVFESIYIQQQSFNTPHTKKALPHAVLFPLISPQLPSRLSVFQIDKSK